MPENSWNIVVHKEICDKQHPYAAINLNAMFNASQDLGADSAFVLWIFLAKNQDGYTFDLSKKNIENEFGMKKDKYYRARDRLVEKGYLVDRGKDHYTFYEVPLAEKPTMKSTVGKPANVPLAEKPTPDVKPVQSSIGGFSDNVIKVSENPPKIGVGFSDNKSPVKSSIGGFSDKMSTPSKVPLAVFQTTLSEKPPTLSEKPYRNITNTTEIIHNNAAEFDSSGVGIFKFSEIQSRFEEGTYEIKDGICYRDNGEQYKVIYDF